MFFILDIMRNTILGVQEDHGMNYPHALTLWKAITTSRRDHTWEGFLAHFLRIWFKMRVVSRYGKEKFMGMMKKGLNERPDHTIPSFNKGAMCIF